METGTIRRKRLFFFFLFRFGFGFGSSSSSSSSSLRTGFVLDRFSFTLFPSRPDEEERLELVLHCPAPTFFFFFFFFGRWVGHVRYVETDDFIQEGLGGGEVVWRRGNQSVVKKSASM